MAERLEIAVWWLRPAEVRQLVGFEDGTVDLLARLGVPDYIANEARSICGRAGRGRLWTPLAIKLDSIMWSGEHANTERASESAGIVIWRADIDKLRGLPGLLTDGKLGSV